MVANDDFSWSQRRRWPALSSPTAHIITSWTRYIAI